MKICNTAIKGSRRPKEKSQCRNQRIAPASWKIAAWQLGYCASLFKKLQHGNWGIALAKLKIAARQSGYYAGLFKKLRRDNWGIALAKIKIASSKTAARQSGDRAGQNKIAMAQQSPWRWPKQMTYGNVPQRQPHNNQQRRGWPEETVNPNQTWRTT
jgi:hypothetical protein